MPVIVVKSRDGSQSYLLEEGRPLFVGRAKECDITLPTPTVSRKHAVILWKNGVCGIKDLGSFNGTLVNDRPIDRPRHLVESDAVKISFYTFTLDMRTQAPGPGTSPSLFVAPLASDTAATADETIGMGAGMQEAIRQAPPDPDNDASLFQNSDIRLPRSMKQPSGDYSREARHDTVFFKEKEPEDLTDASRPTGIPGARDEIVTIDAETALTRAEAEAVIPLMDTGVDPTLTLEEDEETNLALERLIEDLPTYHRERLEGPEAAMEALVAATDLPGDPGDPDETSSSLSPGAAVAGDISAIDTGAFEAVPDSDPDETRSGMTALLPARAAADAKPSARLDADAATGAADIVENIPLSPEFMAAINTRLSLYALLFDLAEERRMMRTSAGGGLAADVQAELDRQDAELDNIPTAEEAAKLLAPLQAAQKADAEGAPRNISEEMRAAENLAVSQLLLIRESNLEALPAVYKLAYRLAFDEPLARELSKEKIPHGRLFGGAVYLLALEALALSANEEKKRISDRIKNIPEEGLDPNASNVFRKLGRMATSIRNRDEIRQKTAQLEDEGKSHGNRADLAEREKRFMLKTLSREFRQTYTAAALHYIPDGRDMPMAVRAFIRYGAIGFKPWWMREEVREFIQGDCTDNVLSTMEHEWNGVNILYTDEYLEAVAAMECSPSPDERLNRPDRDVTDLKTDRAYRRIVNARSYNILMERMLAGLDDRLQNLEREGASIAEQIAEKEASTDFGAKEGLVALRTEEQAVAIRKSNLQSHIARIESEVVTSILESVQEAEGAFRKGDLIMPEAEFLIRRELTSLFENARRMEGRKESFMPLVLRDRFPLNRDIVTIRGAIRVKMMALESLDPGVFVNVVIPAKKRLNRVELRMSPTMIVFPAAGERCVCSAGREGMEGGHLLLPLCFARENMRNRQLIRLLADFRWETSRLQSRKDVIHSDTLAGAFMRIRWDWRNRPKAAREKGLIFSELTDAANWERVYELYLTDARKGGKKLFTANQELYDALIGAYIDLPHGAQLLK